MAKDMLINVSEGEECRIALMENGRLEELYMERTSSTSHVGNIYKGRVTNVEASIQAAFVDFGLGRNGFLHISDLMPTYFGRRGEDIVETVGQEDGPPRPPAHPAVPPPGRRDHRPDHQGGHRHQGPDAQLLPVDPGQYLVMMPGVGKMGVSQKIEDDAERRRLRQILDGLKPPTASGSSSARPASARPRPRSSATSSTSRASGSSSRRSARQQGSGRAVRRGRPPSRARVRDFFSADVDRIIIDNPRSPSG
jgi:ribonuclease E